MSSVYDSEDCRVFAEALDKACKIFVRTGRLTATNSDVVKAALTFAILEAAQKSERNVQRLAVGAVARMARFEVQTQAERSLIQSSSRHSA